MQDLDSCTLRELRALTGHSAAWCAEHVGRVGLRSWNYWESGIKQGYPVRVPDDVMRAMRALAAAVQGVLVEYVPPESR